MHHTPHTHTCTFTHTHIYLAHTRHLHITETMAKTQTQTHPHTPRHTYDYIPWHTQEREIHTTETERDTQVADACIGIRGEPTQDLAAPATPPTLPTLISRCKNIHRYHVYNTHSEYYISLCVYIYIDVHLHIHVYIYIHVFYVQNTHSENMCNTLSLSNTPFLASAGSASITLPMGSPVEKISSQVHFQ